MKKIIFSLLIVAIAFNSNGQRKKRKGTDPIPSPTTAAQRAEGFEMRKKLESESLLNNVDFRNVGPTIMNGRIVDVEVNPNDPAHFYVAYASGGLWETTNEGGSYRSMFDNEIVMSIGDIAVDWENNVIYVGTGENNSSRSSYSGHGMFKSIDNGESWENIGLEDTHHIGRIILHPDNPETLWVGALGRLYSENDERGLYKSTDGGKTWSNTLFVDSRSGIIDLVINPENPDELIAAAWEKDRKAWNFVESGNGTAMYKSTDGGNTWNKISGEESGFPDTEGTGRIGLSYAGSNTVFAVLDNQDRRPKEEEEESGLDKDDLRTMTSESFAALENKDINDYLDRYRFPRSYNAVDIKSSVKSGEIKPVDLVTYVEDANSLLFDSPVKSAEVYKSTDGGATWSKTHEDYIESTIFSYGYYFGQIRHNPSNPDQLYILGVPVLSSEDGGSTWENINGRNVHVDHHALWVNPSKSGHLILGNDGGIHITKDNGETWVKTNSVPAGQFYYVNVDMAEPYNVYGGLQDNGVWYGPSNYKYSDSWHQQGKYPYEEIMGGDGMQVAIDTRDNATVYTGFQFGNYYRLNTKTGDRKYITPRHKLGESPYRWNWQSPILLSSHNQDIVYFGSNKFHRSMDKGETFETLSGDLTKGGKKGDVPYGTLTAISESPLRFGLLYVGSDDGLIHVSKDAGKTWTKISNTLPQNYWVARVIASSHSEGRVYAVLNGYRWDNFEALAYVSNDYGKTWTKIGNDLPTESLNVIKEDPVNENLIYVGSDHGLYASLDRGSTFMNLGNLPKVPVHDVVVHPRENELVVGTHGRSIYIGDVSVVQKLTSDITAKLIHIFAAESIRHSSRWGSKNWEWGEVNTPQVSIDVYSQSESTVKVKVSKEDTMISEWEIVLTKGLSNVNYDLSIDQANLEAFTATLKEGTELEAGDNDVTYLTPGEYQIQIGDQSTTIEITAPRERKPRKG